MELDTGIIYVLLFLFFVLPSLLKRKKKKAAPSKKRPALGFGKLGENLRAFMRELEKQALEAKKKSGQTRSEPSGGTGPQQEKSIWDLLNGSDRIEEEPLPPAGTDIPAEAVDDPPQSLQPVPREEQMAGPEPGDKSDSLITPVPKSPVRRGVLPAHSLQQAVVWSEILGPPKALQRD